MSFQEEIEAGRLALTVAAYEEWVRRVELAERLEIEEPAFAEVLQEFLTDPVVSAARTEWIRRRNTPPNAVARRRRLSRSCKSIGLRPNQVSEDLKGAV